jgi:amino acid transporter
MALSDAILGKPLASSESKKEELSVWTGVPVLGLDALASTGYGPEAALTVFSAIGLAGLHYFPIIAMLVVVQLSGLYISYRQTAEAYPNGGGAYNVTKDNFGAHAALWAAVALLLDYLLNVAVAISAGIGAVVSAIPRLHPHMLLSCLIVLFTLAFVNLRGVRESGLVFVLPVAAFVICLTTTIAIGLFKLWHSSGHPIPLVAPPAIPASSATLSHWLLLTAFANGCTAMTGIEAVSNGVPLFSEPKVPNAHKTLTAIVVILSFFLLCLGYLCPAYHIVGMHEQQAGYQNVLSQLVAAVAGRNIFYYFSLACIFIVLTYSAQTSFTDFPRVCRFLAQDRFLPPGFATRGRRLVFSHGIIVLTVLSAVLLVVFGGITEKLIPLFAVGAFSAFLFSQAGMVRHWLRKRGPRYRVKLFCNGMGAVITSISLVIIVIAKFSDGAWLTVIVAPLLVLLLSRINGHYRNVERQIHPAFELQASKLQAPVVIVPIDDWNCVTEKALQFGMLLSDDITAVHISDGDDNKKRLMRSWREKVDRPARSRGFVAPRLKIVDSPYRRIHKPILDFVNKTAQEKPDRLVAVIIPELVESHWYDYLLHNLRGARLRAQLFLQGNDRVVVINTPWRVRDT